MRRLTSVGAVVAVAVAGLAASTALSPAGASLPTAGFPAAGANLSSQLQAEQANAAATADAIALAEGEKLIVRGIYKDPDGTQHVRYDRTYQGLKVFGGDLIVRKDAAGKVERVIKNVSTSIAVPSTTPKVARSAAESKGAKVAGVAADKADSSLVVFAAKGTPKLAYEVETSSIKADQTPSELHVFVDANSGAELGRYDHIRTGTGNTMYSGTVSIGTSKPGTNYEMRDPSRGGNYTTDLNGSTSGTGTVFSDPDDTWGNGSPSNRQTAGADAHYGSQLTWDYYKNVHSRNGIWDNGTGARSRVHYGNAYVNAFWDGTQMTYGDGAGNQKPLTAIDVAGHEMSHGVTENTANLNYFGDAGGLNESTSDIFGTAVEFSANNSADPGDYLIGEKIDIRGNGTPLRWMDKPSKDGASVDCWSTSTGGMDPHYSSGPLNHWFYLASEGTGSKVIGGVTHSSTACDGGTVTAVGRDVAAKVWYRTLSTKLSSGSNYAAARNGAIASAKELYGVGSAQCLGIERAFTAISVPAGTETCGGGNPDPGGNLLKNPGFESGFVDWTGTAGPITNNTGRSARGGTWKLWLGGNGRTSTETVNQTVAIPASATAPKLSYWMRSDTSESGSTVYDRMRVQIVDGSTTATLATYTNVGTVSAYAQKTHDLAAYKGKTVTVRFTMTEDASLQTSWVVDDTALTTS